MTEQSERLTEADKLLETLALAISKKWDGETPRRRENALSPNIEDALDKALAYLDSKPKAAALKSSALTEK